MTLFGIIWIGAIISCFSRIKNLFALLLLSSVLQCSNVISVGEFAVGPQVITSLVFIIRYIMGSRYEIRRPDKINSAVLFLLFAVLVSLLFNGVISTYLIYFIQLLSYAVCFMLLRNIVIDSATIYKYIKRLTIFVLVMGIVQILITSGFFPRLSIIESIFYNEQESVVFNWPSAVAGNYYRLTSTFMEPSYCSCFLVAMLFYFASVYQQYRNTGNFVLMCCIVVELLLTQSSTGYGALLIGGLLFILLSKNIEAKKIVSFCGIICVVFVVIFARDVLDEVIFDKVDSSSGIVRGQWNARALRAFAESIIFGCGYKSVRGSSLFYSLLGQLGLLGFIAYFVLNLILIIPLFYRGKSNISFYLEGLRFGLFAVIVCQMIACPDLDLNAYWCVMWMLAPLLKRSTVDVYRGQRELIYKSCN